ncbi:MAG: alanine racemase [Aquimonas sp.]|nr:alanine racemase [Xanthomonadales bacterium]MCC6506679.1 alanine racemase [Aquimonas sp.]
MSRATCATIHLDALRKNLHRIRLAAPASQVMAVVKADGYGHGLERVARAFSAADAFGVAALSDAERLRAAGEIKRIVLLSGPDEAADISRLRDLQVDIVIHHESQLRLLSEAGAGDSLRVWLKIDTGMSRLGFAASQAMEVYRWLRECRHVDPDIVCMTHFACSDEFAKNMTSAQIQRFAEALDGADCVRSMANSAAVLGWPQSHAQWIRPGGALYGLSSVEGRTGVQLGLQPAMTLSTRLIADKWIEPGTTVGYGAGFVAPQRMRLGIAAIGYGDGYPRLAGTGTPILVGGRRTGLVGRVSMDLLALDLTDLPEARVGDPVVAWGEGLPIEEVATCAGTLGYELACGITRRVRFEERDR